MLTNVITDAFNGVTSIPVACDLLEAFASLAKRPAVQRAVEKRAAEVHVEFLTQVRERWSWESGGHGRVVVTHLGMRAVGASPLLAFHCVPATAVSRCMS